MIKYAEKNGFMVLATGDELMDVVNRKVSSPGSGKVLDAPPAENPPLNIKRAESAAFRFTKRYPFTTV